MIARLLAALGVPADRLVVAGGIGAVRQSLRLVQTVLVTNYALAIALGMVVLVGIYLGLSSTLFR